MKLFTKMMMLTVLFVIPFQVSIAADAVALKDKRDGAALLTALYDNIDAGKLDTLAEIPSITRILGGDHLIAQT